MENFWAERHVSGTEAAFVAVANPIGCNRIVIRNGNAPDGVAIRCSTDVGVAQGYDLIPPGDSKTIELRDTAGNGRMLAGAVNFNLKSDSAGAFDAFCTFLV
jgi:hypothetical protein